MVTTENGIHPEYSDAGDTAFFEISVENLGNVRLSQVFVLLDDAFGDTLECDRNYSSPSSGFLPSSSPGGHPILCEASKVVSFADVEAGIITGAAEVSC